MATADLLTMAPKTGDRQKALDSALAQIERQFGKGSIMTLGEGAVIPGVRGDLHRLNRPGYCPRHWRLTQGSDH